MCIRVLCIVNEHLNSVGLWMTLLYLSLEMQNSLCHLILSILHVVEYVSCCNMLYQNEVKNDDVNLFKNGFPKDVLPKLTNKFLCNCKFLIFPLIGVTTFCKDCPFDTFESRIFEIKLNR